MDKYKSNRKSFLTYFFLYSTFLLVATQSLQGQISFDQSNLNFNGNGDVSAVTSMSFGPDNRLYVVEYTGAIKILTIERSGSTTYNVTNNEVLDGILTIQDHNDDGTTYESNSNNFRETIGIVVSGTAANPVFYVSSSDFRIGAGSGGGNGDIGLDTNSGIITRFSWNGTAWDVVDIVRGLPRSEENHATNGLQLATINGTNYLLAANGGNTNGGSPSTNFVFTCEYALSAAVLAIDLDMLNTMPILDDNGRDYIYDIPTLDDPTRANVNGITDPDTLGYDGIDVNDPFGGNDGLNMGMVVPNGPVKILSPGYRNAYDLVVTEDGALYVTDNGANQGWGGFPANEGGGSVTNEYIDPQPGNNGEAADGEYINNGDHLELVTSNISTYDFNNPFYGGHPNPVRANPQGAGLYTDNNSSLNSDSGSPVWRTQVYDPDGSTPGSTDNPDKGLPANWPPVQNANPVEGDWRGPGINNPAAEGPDDNPVVVWGTNTNAIDEYTATNFNGALQGNLLAGHNGGNIRRVILSLDGTSGTLEPNFFSGIGGNVLGLTCNSDTDIFPGTVWAGTLSGTIIVYEPIDFLTCINPGEQDYDALADYDEDGYTNQDEEDNNTDPCNGGSQPTDFNKLAGGTLISDLNGNDDDSDGIIDANDPFQLGDFTTSGSDAFNIPISNDLFNDQQGLGGIFGLGMTGLMNNGDTGLNWLNWIDRRDDDNDPNPNDVLGGAPGIMTSHMTSGTAYGLTNSQEKGYQYGVQVNSTTDPFSVIGGMNGFSGGSLRLYGNTLASGGELGFFIGDGTQSNYIKFVVTTAGFTVLQEIDDIPQTQTEVTASLDLGERPTDGIRFYFKVNPQTGVVDLDYKIDSNARVNIASITAQGKVLEAIQQSNLDLAVGFIGTSGTAGVELEGSWDFLNVLSVQPIVSSTLPDIDRLIGSTPESIDLNTFFNDDDGPEALTFSIAGNTNPSINAVVNSNILDLSFPATPAISNITIRATDAENNFIEQTFIVNVTDEPIVLYRVNTGGAEITAIDGDMNWSADTEGSNSEFLIEPGSNGSYNGTLSSTTSAVDTNKVPLSIFASERSDTSEGAPNVTYAFPVAENGNYEVRLFFMNGWPGTNDLGERIFDVTLEGNAYPELTKIDLSGTYGHQVGTMITHIVPVSDGILNISLVHDEIENPLINGIEILKSTTTETVIYAGIDDQINVAGDALAGDLGIQAIGGDGNLTFSATGLPPGVSIEPTNGQIGGTIDIGAEVNSPYLVTVTIDDSDAISTDAITLEFTWTVSEISRFRFRLNAAGGVVQSTDGETDWVANNGSGFVSGVGYTVNTGNTASAGLIYANRDVASIPSYIDEATFNAIFDKERWASPGTDMQFNIPLPNGNYMVNLYMGNYASGTQNIGERIFDISLEGTIVENDLDLVARFGHLKGGMISYPLTLTDEEVNILFEHVVENPLINAIEIISIDGNQPPIAIASATPLAGDPPLEVTFTGSLSTDDAGIDTYLWNFGDGNTSTVADPIHTYNTQGSYTAILTVTDAEGLQDTEQLIIAVGNQAPIAIASATPLVGAAPLDVTFTGSGSTDDNTIVSYNWDFGNGDSSTEQDPSYQFTEVGIYTVTLTVDDGETTDMETIVIEVTCPWNDLADSNLEKIEAQSAKVGDKLYVFAGFLADLIITPDTEVYDTTTDVWTTAAPMPIPVTHMGIAVVGTDIWIISGFAGNHPGTPENAVQIYNTLTDSWSYGPSLPAPNASGAAVFNNGKIHYLGGLLPDRNTDVGDHFVLDVNNQGLGWTTAAPLLNPRNHLSAASVNGLVYAIGGQHAHDVMNEVDDQDDLDVYDPATDTWTSLANLPSARSHFEPGTDVHNGKIIIVGGREGELFFYDDITEYDPITNTWTESCKLPEKLLAPAAKVFGDRLIVTNGGVDGTGGPSSAARWISVEPELSTLELNSVADQSNLVGDSSSLTLVAGGGNSNETITYAISGQPTGIVIDPNTGQISGTIDAFARDGGPLNDGMHLVTVTASRPYSEDATQDFIWTIGLVYNGTSWIPNAPDENTELVNAFIMSGAYTVDSDIMVHNLSVQPGATLIIEAGNSITTTGDVNIKENGSLELGSTSMSYSSLIPDTESTVNGDVIYKRHVNNTAAQGATGSNDLIAPPVSGQAFNDFLTNNSNIVSNSANTMFLFGPFNKTNGAYDIYADTETATLDAGTGYRAGSTDNATFTFTGTVNTGPIEVAITNSGPAFQEWNLIGNPYPSYINLGAFLSENTLAFGANSAAIYGYDGDASDGWIVYNQAYADLHPEALIAPGQGFFVASEALEGTVNFLPAMRDKGTSDDFILGRSPSSIPGFLKLSLNQSDKTAHTDFYFSPNASRSLDRGYDAQTWGGNPSNFSLHSYLVEENTGLPMVIQSLGETDYTDVQIPLGINANSGEQISISISENSLPSTVEVYLEDQVNQSSVLLNNSDYIMTPDNTLNSAGRFFLRFSDTTLSSETSIFNDINIFSDSQNQSIVISGLITEPSIAKLYDVQGRAVISNSLRLNTNRQNIKVNELENGVYIISIESATEKITKKLIIK